MVDNIEIEKRESEEINEKRESHIRLGFEEDDDDNDNNTFSPGETIRGKITIENSLILKIRKIEVILGAIEFVQAQRVKKRTEIHPKYKEKIEWNKTGDNTSVVPFEMHILKEIRRSYFGNILNITGCLRRKSIYHGPMIVLPYHHTNCLLKED